MERFDAIVVGAGPAGSAAAYHLAKAGLGVVLVERGSSAGSKNVSGALLYPDPIAGVWPDFLDGAPLERRVASHRFAMLHENRSVVLEYGGEEQGPTVGAYTIQRSKFDPWLAARAEAAGAALITSVTVDELLLDSGRVVGVRAGTDELGAGVVIVADGAKSLLLRGAGLRAEFDPHDMALGIKEVIELPRDTIEARFGCGPETGAAYTILGRTAGVEGGGFLYTNRESLSVGAVVKLDSLAKQGIRPQQVLDDLKSHPLVANLIDGGTPLEYSAQTVHRGRFAPGSKLSGDGLLVVGSAAGLLLNNIVTLRGIDFAIVSGVIAARAAIAAHQRGAFDKATLAAYDAALKSTPVYADWRTYKDAFALMDNERLFTIYPELACSVMGDMLTPRRSPSRKAFPAARRRMRGRVSLLRAGRDAWAAARGLVL